MIFQKLQRRSPHNMTQKAVLELKDQMDELERRIEALE